jgi:L-ascorbate metabolism protein UlaG (beta-lactamase superfamily)
MIVTHHGNQCFKFQFGDTTIATNPISKDSVFEPVRFGANVCLVSINHEDFNGADQMGFGEKQPFVISGPGEYEIRNIFIKGYPSVSHYGVVAGATRATGEDTPGAKDLINTIYTFNLDGINVCFLGALDSKDIADETLEAIDEVDMLFVPIGGNGVLSAEDAYKLAVKFEPKVIIPMGFDTSKTKEQLKIFLKEGGSEDVKPVDKLTVKRKDLEGKEGDIIVLSST